MEPGDSAGEPPIFVSYLFKNIFTTVMVCLHVVVMVCRSFNNLIFSICALIQQLGKS